MGNKAKRKFSHQQIVHLAVKMIRILQDFHGEGLIHRDIKPDNIVFGAGDNKDQIYLIDYGMVKMIRRDGKHIEFREDKNLVGTIRFSSISANAGKEQGRKDDMEAFGYVLVYLAKQQLPWQDAGWDLKPKQRFEKILEIKENTLVADLCEGLPNEILRYMEYCRNLMFNDK